MKVAQQSNFIIKILQSKVAFSLTFLRNVSPQIRFGIRNVHIVAIKMMNMQIFFAANNEQTNKDNRSK